MMAKRHLEAATASERAKVRKKFGSLKSLSVQPVTRARYEIARAVADAWLKHEQLILSFFCQTVGPRGL